MKRSKLTGCQNDFKTSPRNLSSNLGEKRICTTTFSKMGLRDFLELLSQVLKSYAPFSNFIVPNESIDSIL